MTTFYISEKDLVKNPVLSDFEMAAYLPYLQSHGHQVVQCKEGGNSPCCFSNSAVIVEGNTERLAQMIRSGVRAFSPEQFALWLVEFVKTGGDIFGLN